MEKIQQGRVTQASCHNGLLRERQATVSLVLLYGHGEAFTASHQPCIPSAAGRHNCNWFYFCLQLGGMGVKCCHSFFWEIRNKLFFVSCPTLLFHKLLRNSDFNLQNVVFVFIVYWLLSTKSVEEISGHTCTFPPSACSLYPTLVFCLFICLDKYSCPFFLCSFTGPCGSMSIQEHTWLPGLGQHVHKSVVVCVYLTCLSSFL